MCCEPGGKGHGHGHCNHGCCGGVPAHLHRKFLSKKERMERLENYLKELDVEIKEVEKRLEQLKKED